ncbi:flagellar brake protein [Brevibacillus daliensis]|uniref:flagellar brake protein n=1 Tax=Brevibacillus daliensis TaxID=2892995 RepID=UPI001E53C9B8|nr:flagellar brake domain-containing protein [Brevibacillus daliensis]
MSVLPQVGQVMHLSLASLTDENSKQIYKTRVADYSDKEIAIELPTEEDTGKASSFPSGVTCFVWYIGNDGSRYDFVTSVVGRKRENIPMLLLAKVPKEEIVRTQRRGYLRVQASLEISISYLKGKNKQTFLARTIDISGGGLAFTCPKHYIFHEQQELEIWLSLPSKNGSVSHSFSKARVIRVNQQEHSSFSWVSVKYTEISEADRAKIVRICYERQLEDRQKGLTD